MGGVGDVCIRESTLRTFCRHQKCGGVGIPSVHQQEEMAGKLFFYHF